MIRIATTLLDYLSKQFITEKCHQESAQITNHKNRKRSNVYFNVFEFFFFSLFLSLNLKVNSSNFNYPRVCYLKFVH